MPSQRTSPLRPAQRSALGSMPVRLQFLEGGWHLDYTAPRGDTLKSLERRGLIEYVESDHVWRRTALGERVWEMR